MLRNRGRLTGLDTGFLAMEREFQSLAVGALAVLAADAPPLTLGRLRDHVQERLEVLPAFRRRLVPVPGGLGRPLAVSAEPDLARHVVRLHLDSLDDLDGTRDADSTGEDVRFEALVARLSEETLPSDRPLWRLVLVDGLSGGRQALVLQLHHALADGTALLSVFRRLFSDEPVPAAEVTPVPRLRSAPPGPVPLLLGALLSQLLVLGRLPRLLLRTWRGVRDVRHRRRVSDVEVPGWESRAPWTVLNEAFTSRRTFTTTTLPLDGLRQVRAATGATLNDVVLAVVAGAVRRLLGPGEVPARPLLAQVPVADPDSSTGALALGNAFWSLTTSLATDVADPLERLRRISAVTTESKAQLTAFGVGLVPAWLDVVPPRLLRRGVDRAHERLRTGTPDVDATVTVSNLRGPAGPYTCGGRSVTGLYIAGPPTNGVGLNICVVSYGAELDLAVLACADAMPRPAAVVAALQESWTELAAATRVPAGVTPGTLTRVS